MIKTVLKVVIIIFLIILLLYSILLSLIPKDMILLNSVLDHTNRNDSTKEDKILNFMPKAFSIFIIPKIEKSCYSESFGDKMNYVNIFVDVAYGNFPTDESIILKENAKKAAVAFIKKGCDINEKHPYTNLAPIHTAFLFAKHDIEFTKFLISEGADPNLELPISFREKVSGDTAMAILDFLSENGDESADEIRMYLESQ